MLFYFFAIFDYWIYLRLVSCLLDKFLPDLNVLMMFLLPWFWGLGVPLCAVLAKYAVKKIREKY